MNNIITFPGRVSVEIYAQTIQTETVTGEHGSRAVLANIGQPRYFVDVIERDGGRMSMWDGADYADAVREANLLANDFGGKVSDLTNGAA